MENLLAFQEDLASKYKYKQLDPMRSDEVRRRYRDNLPPGFKLEGDNTQKLYTSEGTLICNGYERIVIGDYGAFIEFSVSQAVTANYKIKEGQEYRINDPRYSGNVKYNWLTAKDNSNIKIYHQKKIVDYADYRIGMYYISPYEAIIM